MDSIVLDDNSARQFLERRLQENDVKGAIDFARREQNKFPKLKRLFRFLGNIVVQVSTEDEEIDWYTVLGVDPLVDPKTMKQRYVQLTKNNRLRSYEAHKLLNKAWDILSNKCTRKDYDLRRRSREIQQNALAKAMPASENVSQAFSNINNAVVNYQPAPVLYSVSGNNVSGLRLVSSDTQLIQPAPGLYNISGNNGKDLTKVTSDTHLIQPATGLFNVERNNGSVPRLVSSDAQSIQPAPGLYNVSGNNESCLATVSSSNTHLIQAAPPPGLYNLSGNSGNVSRLVSTDTQSIQPVPGLYNISGNKGSGLATVSSATQLIQPARVYLKRLYEGDQTCETRAKAPCIDVRESAFSMPPVAGSICKTDVIHKERMILVKETLDGRKQVPENHMPAGSDGQKGEYLCPSGNAQAEKVTSVSRKGNSKKKLSDVEKNILMKKARNVILNELNEWYAASRDNNEGNPADNIENVATKGPEEDWLKTMEVPDSDFYDFDKDRTRKSFAENQVWAVYDEDDGMPRLYALIRKVSKRPFKLQISWLNSKTNMELESIKWIDSGFHKTCGDFWVGKKEISIKLNSFSHRVTGWTKAARVFHIIPKKGDVWALYRNWSPDWSEHTTEDEKHKYNMVEVLEDYHDEKGVIIVPLVKVAGFKAVFCQHSDAKEVRTVPKEEIFRFSHQVSSYLLTEEEAPHVPKGSKELDPAAMPLELLRVIN